jgi:hypothetical protein
LRRVESCARRAILDMSTQLAAHALLATSERFRLAPRIIFHAGTPKTGTTSLQLFMDRNRDALLDRGVLYPRAGVLPPPEPKHHWIVTSLLNGDVANFTTMLDRAISEARSDTHTILLSSEGLSHRWWDFSPAGLDMLGSLATRFEMELWVFFREPVAFFRSLYVQTLKNPRLSGTCYGTDLSVDGMLCEPWFRKQLDYAGYIRDVERHLGPGSIRPFRYDGDTISAALAALKVTDLDCEPLRENRTMGEVGVDLLRRINRHGLDGEARRHAVGLIEQLDDLLGGSANPLRLDADAAEQIEKLACYRSLDTETAC